MVSEAMAGMEMYYKRYAHSMEDKMVARVFRHARIEVWSRCPLGFNTTGCMYSDALLYIM